MSFILDPATTDEPTWTPTNACFENWLLRPAFASEPLRPTNWDRCKCGGSASQTFPSWRWRCSAVARTSPLSSPCVRQHVFGELESALIPSRILAFVPGVSVGRRRRFIDRNESSPTLGKTKVGEYVEFRFDIDPKHVDFFQWSSRTEGRIPQAR